MYLCTLLTTKDDSLAQQVEHIPFKDGVLGSNPKRITSTLQKELQIHNLQLFLHRCFYQSRRQYDALCLSREYNGRKMQLRVGRLTYRFLPRSC